MSEARAGLRVLSVASEAVPLIKTGGLADVAGALPGALADEGISVTTLLPGYPTVLSALGRARKVHAWESLFGSPARLLSGKLGDYPLYVLDCPALFDRDGLPYVDRFGRDWPDNWRRFCALGRAAADVAGGAVELRGKPQAFDVLHAHDWQGAMAAAYARYAPYGGRTVPSVVTVHNIAFQGRFDLGIFPELGLPERALHMQGVEYYGGVGMLKAGLFCADAITTVSPTYASEIRTPEFGMGLEGLISERGRDVHGILNGIDTHVWNPATDPSLVAPYSARSLAKRVANKRALEDEFALVEDDGPLFVAITRLTWQKGMDLLPEIADHIVASGGRLAVLGSGDAGLEDALKSVAARHPGRVAVRIGYDEGLSHRMQGGGDAILIPSRFEPCGLTQLYGLAYGCVPIVARTGGLADTVIDANPAALAAGVATGIQFDGVDLANVTGAVSRAVALYRMPEEWLRLQKNGMKADFSWKASGRAYARLYRSLMR